MWSIFTPTFPNHFWSAVAMNALPLSDLMCVGGLHSLDSSAKPASTSV